MRMTEYIEALEWLVAAHGDLEVVHAVAYAPLGAVNRKITLPKPAPIKVKSPRESYEKTAVLNGDKVTGETVFVI